MLRLSTGRFDIAVSGHGVEQGFSPALKAYKLSGFSP